MKNKKISIISTVIVLIIACSLFGKSKISTPTNSTSTTQQQVDTTLEKAEAPIPTEPVIEEPKQQEQVQEVVEIDNPVNIHFIDTGNSDCILICDNGKYMIIDGADNDDEKMLVDYLGNLGITKVDYVVLTHPDADHCGGLDAIINNFDIGQVFVGNGDADTKTYKDFVQAAINKDLKPSVPLPNQEFTLGYGSFQFFNQTSKRDNANDNSLVALYTIGNNKFLFTGDSGKEVEAELPLDAIGKVDVLKVGHHGSKTSSSDKFIESVSPRYSVICCGENNKYGHPDQETLSTLENHKSKVLRTDINGNIVFTSNGKLIDIEMTKSHSNKHSEGVNPNADVLEEAKNAPEETPSSESSNNADAVYITDTGSKYHRGSCSSLKKSKIEISLDEAKSSGYTPCKRCNP